MLSLGEDLPTGSGRSDHYFARNSRPSTPHLGDGIGKRLQGRRKAPLQLSRRPLCSLDPLGQLPEDGSSSRRCCVQRVREWSWLSLVDSSGSPGGRSEPPADSCPDTLLGESLELWCDLRRYSLSPRGGWRLDSRAFVTRITFSLDTRGSGSPKRTWRSSRETLGCSGRDDAFHGV